MLKKRLVATLVVIKGMVVQSIGFERHLPVGHVPVAVEFLNKWGIDEIVILDMDATREGRKPDFAMIIEASKRGFVPLTVGGGITEIDDIRRLIHCGADKVCLNTAGFEAPDLISQAAKVFGAQCIVVSIDVRRHEDGSYAVYRNNGQVLTDLSAASWASRMEQLGAGEIFLNSIDRDGRKTGFDLEIINQVCAAVSIPVIACGGAGTFEHFHEAFTQGAACAYAAGNIFHFAEHTPVLLKAYLKQKGVDIRNDTYANYQDITFDSESRRILKRPEAVLEKLKYEYQPEEVI